MGGCSSDIYQTVKKQYGEVLQQFIVSSQSLVSFKEFVRNKEQQYDAKNTSKKQSLHRQVQQREQLVKNHFSQAKVHLDAGLPFGVGSYEQMKKGSLQNLLGLEHYKRKFQQVHARIDNEFNQQKVNFHKQTEQIVKKAEQESKLKVNDEKLKLFHQMTDDKKKHIHDKGVKDFDQLIKARKNQLQTAQSDKLNPEVQLQKLNKIISLQSLDTIVNEARGHFRTETQNILGTNLESDIRV